MGLRPSRDGTGTLETGAKSVAIPITIIDDARLEDTETVTFAVTADGAAIGTVELTIDDDDRAVLAVVGPEEPCDGGRRGLHDQTAPRAAPGERPAGRGRMPASSTSP